MAPASANSPKPHTSTRNMAIRLARLARSITASGTIPLFGIGSRNQVGTFIHRIVSGGYSITRSSGRDAGLFSSTFRWCIS